MTLINREEVKEFLGITSASLDLQIDLYIPIIESTARLIIGGKIEQRVIAQTMAGSKDVSISGIILNNSETFSRFGFSDLPNTHPRGYIIEAGLNQPDMLDKIADYVRVGALIQGPNIPDGTYVESVDYNRNKITISQVAAASESGESEIGFSLALKPILAKGVMWQISQTNEGTDLDSVSARSLGPASVSFNRGSGMDKKYGMPEWFVRALAPMRKMRGF